MQNDIPSIVELNSFYLIITHVSNEILHFISFCNDELAKKLLIILIHEICRIYWNVSCNWAVIGYCSKIILCLVKLKCVLNLNLLLFYWLDNWLDLIYFNSIKRRNIEKSHYIGRRPRRGRRRRGQPQVQPPGAGAAAGAAAEF